MKIEQATVTDLRTVAANMRARDFAEFSAVCGLDTRREVADLFVERYANRPDAICGSTDEEPIAIGLVVESRPNVVTLGFLATDEFPLIAAPLTRFIRRLFKRLRAAGCHRIECVSIDGYDEAHRWLEVLGLRHEAEHPGYGKRGEKFHTYAWVKDVRAPGD